MASIKYNKAHGHQVEAEAAEITQRWPEYLRMQRTGLDGGHDLRGPHAIGEVKAVRKGPVWLQSMLAQLDNGDCRYRIGMAKLGQGPGKRARWLVVLGLEEFEALVGE